MGRKAIGPGFKGKPGYQQNLPTGRQGGAHLFQKQKMGFLFTDVPCIKGMKDEK